MFWKQRKIPNYFNMTCKCKSEWQWHKITNPTSSKTEQNRKTRADVSVVTMGARRQWMLPQNDEEKQLPIKLHLWNWNLGHLDEQKLRSPLL